jgi:cytochrome oxidase Cu insertion factor (SCO1/SenC/PrrC family)
MVCAAGLTAQEPPRLGPVDGADLSPIDTGRVAVGTAAPDFTLEAKDGDTVILSQFRDQKIVVLVFYRGHW